MLKRTEDFPNVAVFFLHPTAFSLLVLSFILFIFGKQIFDTKIEVSRLKSNGILGQLKLRDTALRIFQLAMGLLKKDDLFMTAESSDYQTADLAAQIRADRQQLVEICKAACAMHMNGLQRSENCHDELLNDHYRLAPDNRTFEECISDLGRHTPTSQGKHVDENLAKSRDSIDDSELLNSVGYDEFRSSSSDTECDVPSLTVEGQTLADDVWGITPDELHAGDAETTSRRSEDDFMMRKELEMMTPSEVVRDIAERNRVTCDALCLEAPMRECATCTYETKSLTELFTKYEAERVKNIHLSALLVSADLCRGVLERQIVEEAIRTEKLVNDHNTLLNSAADLERVQTDIDKSVIFELYTERSILRAEIDSLAHECLDLEGVLINRDVSYGNDSSQLRAQCNTGGAPSRALCHSYGGSADVRTTYGQEQRHGRCSSFLNCRADAHADVCNESQHDAAHTTNTESTLRQETSADIYSASNSGLSVFSDLLADENEEHRMSSEHAASLSTKLEQFFPTIGNRDERHAQDNQDYATVNPQVAELRQEIEILTARNVASESGRKADRDTVLFLRQEIGNLRHEMRCRGKEVPTRRFLPCLTPHRGTRLSNPSKTSGSPQRVSGGTSVEEGEGDREEWDEGEGEERGGEWSDAIGHRESECLEESMEEDEDISDCQRSESESEDEEEDDQDQEPFYSVRGVSSSSHSCFRTTPGKPRTLS